MKKFTQRGFSAIELTAVIVLVGLIAGAGWSVWKLQNKGVETVAVSGAPAHYFTNLDPTEEEPFRTAIHSQTP